jgi:hypothetical protein
MFLLILACAAPDGDSPAPVSECPEPVVIDYACHDVMTYTFPEALPLSAVQWVELDDGWGTTGWQMRALDLWPGRTWSSDQDNDTNCSANIDPPIVGGRLVIQYEE